MTASPMPEAVGSPCRRILCTTCASRLLVIWKMGGRWGMCSLCDAGWSRNADLDTVQRVGPPVLLRVEQARRAA